MEKEEFEIFNKRIIELHNHNCKEYRKYNGENYDADYYLFLGRASAYGDMMDILEDMIITKNIKLKKTPSTHPAHPISIKFND